MARRLLIAVLAVMLALPASAQSPALAVIVHPDRRSEVSQDDLVQIYLRRKRFWDDGATIVPLNLAAGTPLRVGFSRRVLRQSEDRLAEFWNRQYFYGTLPPATLASTKAVLRYVASDPNAIGYVPLTEVNDSVRVVLRLD